MATAAVAGHVLGMLAVNPAGNGLGLLPLTLIGLPVTGLLAGFGRAAGFLLLP